MYKFNFFLCLVSIVLFGNCRSHNGTSLENKIEVNSDTIENSFQQLVNDIISDSNFLSLLTIKESDIIGIFLVPDNKETEVIVLPIKSFGVLTKDVPSLFMVKQNKLLIFYTGLEKFRIHTHHYEESFNRVKKKFNAFILLETYDPPILKYDLINGLLRLSTNKDLQKFYKYYPVLKFE